MDANKSKPFVCDLFASIMVFADLNTIEHGMSSLAAGGGTFTSHSSPAPHPSRPSADVNPSSTISAVSTPSEFIPPTFDINDPRAILKTLIRYVMRTFYDLPKSLIIEYIFQHERIKQQYLADLLCIDSKQVRSFIQEFKRDKFIIEDHVLETNDGTTGRRHQDQYYYKIDTTMFINVVRYRLINMQSHVENLERQQTYKQSNYKCEQCSKEYTELDVGKLFGPSQDNFICSICDGLVVEDVETREESVLSNRQVVTMTLFNQEIRPLFDILQRLDEIMKNDLQVKNPSDPDAPRLNGNSVFNHHHPGAGDGHVEDRKPSDASNIFERMTNINHDIQIIIEKDDDDHYSHMDMDETSNTDSGTTAVRGPGKTGKKSSKNAQSTMEVASQPVSTKMKLANKKVPYEPKPLPHWFVGSTVFVDQDEEHRLKNSSSHSTAHALSVSRQLANQRLNQSTTIQGIKQMLLIHESRRTKVPLLATIEDSLSPPTPIPLSKAINSQSSSSLSQINSNAGGGSSAMDDDDTNTSLFHLINEDSVHHMDIDNND